MNRIVIVSVLYLAAATTAQDNDQIIEECARELNITNVEKFREGIKLEDYLANPTDNITCMVACGARKWANSNGTTLYKGLLKAVDISYQMGFNTTNFTRQDVESKINNCFVQEREECEFFKCIEPTKQPFFSVIEYLLKDIIDKIVKALGEALTKGFSGEAFSEFLKKLLSPGQ